MNAVDSGIWGLKVWQQQRSSDKITIDIFNAILLFCYPITLNLDM